MWEPSSSRPRVRAWSNPGRASRRVVYTRGSDEGSSGDRSFSTPFCGARSCVALVPKSSGRKQPDSWRGRSRSVASSRRSHGFQPKSDAPGQPDPRLGAGQPDPLQDRDGGSVSSGESSGVKKKKKRRKKKKKRKRSGGPHRRTKERIKEMLVRSRWNWKGSSIDPMFKKPRLRVNRDHGGSSSRGSNSSSSEDSAESGGLFQEPSQVRRISQKCPGLQTWDVGGKQVPEASRRFLLGGRRSSTRHDEVLPPTGCPERGNAEQTHAGICLDSLVEGNVLGAMDMQRMKSLELMAQGGSPETAMKVEVVFPDTARLLLAGEGHNAAQEQRTSERLETQLRGSAGGNRWMSRWEPPKGDRQGDGKGKGKKGEGKDKGKRWEGGKPAAQTQVVAPGS